MLAKNRIHDRNCIVTINGSHIYNRELDVPNAKPKILDDIVAFEVQSSMSATQGSRCRVHPVQAKSAG